LTHRPLRVALTGGIATGKSHCLAGFARLGADVVDADVLAREVVAPGTPGFAAVVARFGRGILTRDGDIDRAALGSLVFADEIARRDLESIVHPAVYAEIDKRHRESFSKNRKTTPGVVFIADIPLLYETGREGDFDRVIVAACRPEQQIERMKARGLTETEARQRLASQWPVEEKRRRADYAIDTSGTIEATDEQIRDVWRRLRGYSEATSQS
jgi:dephospho-CoA kinase